MMSISRLLLGAVLAFAQASAQFAGTWTATNKGDTFARLELQEANGVLSGRISLGGMHLDKDGVVDNVVFQATNFTPIFDVALRDGVLSFARKDGDDTDRFELRAAGDAVELRIIATKEILDELARDGIAPPKPFRMQKSPR